MFKTKTKLILLLSFAYQYFIVLKEVSCTRSSVDEKIDNVKDDAQSRMWRNKWKEQPKWHMDSYYDSAPYMNVVRGKSREWTNLEHSQPLKRSDEAAGFPASPLTNDLGGLNMSNPISKYHCPINLLYGNNLTVKNYFLLVPRTNESCNETINEIQSVGDEKFEYKAMPHAAHGVTAQNMTIFGVETTVSEESTTESTTLPPTTTVETTVETTEMNTTVSETTTTETTLPPTTLPQEIMRTLEKYCETFNMSDSGAYTIHPVNISIGPNYVIEEKSNASNTTGEEKSKATNNAVEDKANATNNAVEDKANVTNNAMASKDTNSSLAEDKAAANLTESVGLKKQKRAPGDCVKFNMSSDQNYTINPVRLPQGNNEYSARPKVVDMKKKKRNFTSKRPKRRTTSVR